MLPAWYSGITLPSGTTRCEISAVYGRGPGFDFRRGPFAGSFSFFFLPISLSIFSAFSHGSHRRRLSALGSSDFLSRDIVYPLKQAG